MTDGTRGDETFNDDLLIAEYSAWREAHSQGDQQLLGTILAAPAVYVGIAVLAKDLPPGAYWAAVPLVPVLLMGWTLHRSVTSVLSSYYGRYLEVRLRDRSQPGQANQLTSPFFAHISHAATSPTSPIPWIAVNARAGISINTLLLIGVMVLAIDRAGNGWVRLVAAVAYGFALLFMWVGAHQTYKRARKIWGRLTSDIIAVDFERSRTLAGPFIKPDGHRTLSSFLLLPRPYELIFKPLSIYPILLGALALSGLVKQSNIPSTIWWIALFEFVLYQGRYAFNDILNADEDSRRPDSGSRRRFPSEPYEGPSSPEVRATRRRIGLFVSALRMPLWLITGWLLVGNWQLSLAALVAVLVVSGIYEFLRGVSPDGEGLGVGLLILLLVGFGYGLRSVAAYWIITPEPKWLPAMCLGVMMYAVGILSAALSWSAQATIVKEDDSCPRPHFKVVRRPATSTFDFGPWICCFALVLCSMSSGVLTAALLNPDWADPVRLLLILGLSVVTSSAVIWTYLTQFRRRPRESWALVPGSAVSVGLAGAALGAIPSLGTNVLWIWLAAQLAIQGTVLSLRDVEPEMLSWGYVEAQLLALSGSVTRVLDELKR